MKISKQKYENLPEELKQYFIKKEDGVSRNVHPT